MALQPFLAGLGVHYSHYHRAAFSAKGDLVVVTAPLWPALSSNTVVAGYSGVRGVLTSWCVWWWWCLSCCCVVAGGSGWEASEASDGAVMATVAAVAVSCAADDSSCGATRR